MEWKHSSSSWLSTCLWKWASLHEAPLWHLCLTQGRISLALRVWVWISRDPGWGLWISQQHINDYKWMPIKTKRTVYRISFYLFYSSQHSPVFTIEFLYAFDVIFRQRKPTGVRVNRVHQSARIIRMSHAESVTEFVSRN